MNGFVQRKFNDRGHRAPSLRRRSTTNYMADEAINSLSLVIDLRVLRCGHVQSCALQFKD